MSPSLVRAVNGAYFTHVLLIALVLAPTPGRCVGQGLPRAAQLPIDSDHDGMSDDLEQALLQRFAPTFMIAGDDCAGAPAEFRTGVSNPEVQQKNGTIYGQVFPARIPSEDARSAEIHYYHLWARDCGEHGHGLDAEHVSVLVRSSEGGVSSGEWKAEYWYAAAHENTVCDVSQIARASALDAERRGPKVWISPGKHASFLDPGLCESGCGSDRCNGTMRALGPGTVINLGELGHPMNRSLFIESDGWPLAAKMKDSNFPLPTLTRANKLSADQIVWFNEGRHPSQGIIAISSTTEGAIATGGEHAAGGLSTASEATGKALDDAQNSSGNALQKSYRRTGHALGISARRVGEALHIVPKPNAPDQDGRPKAQ